MPSFRFLHAADLHLDTPFAGLGRVAPHVQEALRDASLRAWDALVDLALDEGVAFVVLAGDLYDGADRGLRAQLRVRAGLQRLSDAGIAAFIVHGNHDPLDGWQAIDADGWPDGVVVCPSGEVTSHEVVRDGVRLATLHGISYATRETTENLAGRFPVATGGGLHVGVLHATVGTQPDHSPYAPCTIEDLRAAGYDYWALGHVHGHAVLAEDPVVAYSGSVQGRSPKRTEQGAKGALLVDVVDDRIAGLPRHVALDLVRFVGLDVDLGGRGSGTGEAGAAGDADGTSGTVVNALGAHAASAPRDLAGVVDALLAAGRAATDAHDGRALVLRARLTGAPPASGDLGREGVLAEIVEAVREADADASPWRWWDRVDDATAPTIDRAALAGQESFVGALVRNVDAAAAEPPPPDLPGGWVQQLDDDLAGRIRGRGTAFDVDAAAELRDAEALALSLLVEEDQA